MRAGTWRASCTGSIPAARTRHVSGTISLSSLSSMTSARRSFRSTTAFRVSSAWTAACVYTFMTIAPSAGTIRSPSRGRRCRTPSGVSRAASRPTFSSSSSHRRQPHPGDSGEQAPCRAGSRPGIHTGEAPHPVRGVLPQALGGHGSSRRVRGDNRRL